MDEPDAPTRPAGRLVILPQPPPPPPRLDTLEGFVDALEAEVERSLGSNHAGSLLYRLGRMIEAARRRTPPPPEPAAPPRGRARPRKTDIADVLLGRIRAAGGSGVTTRRLGRECFGGHVPSELVRAALEGLKAAGLVDSALELTKGRYVVRWTPAAEPKAEAES